MDAKRITFKKEFRGHFTALLDNAPTKYTIVNGSLGLSGRDTANIYVLLVGERMTKIQGTLQMCKKTAVHCITRDLAKGGN